MSFNISQNQIDNLVAILDGYFSPNIKSEGGQHL